MNHPAQAQRYLIIGSGVAGIAAAQVIRGCEPLADICLVSDDPAGYYSRPGLAYYLTGEIDEKMLYPLSQDDYRALNVDWRDGRAVRLLPAEHAVEVSDRRGRAYRLAYDRLLLATGAAAAPLNIPGAELRGVFKLDTLSDARSMMKMAGGVPGIFSGSAKARTAVVAGGGITALEIVEGLRAQGLEVHYFLRGDRYWSNVLDETESRIVEKRLEHEGVQIHYQTELKAILGKNGRVAGAQARDGHQLRCELVAVAIGVQPRKELAQSAGLRVERGIVVNEHLQTSAEDIFAAGDVAQVFDLSAGRSTLDSLWGTAREQGYAAGLNMIGQRTVYQKRVSLNITRLAGLTTTIIGTVGRGTDPSLNGIARGDSESWRELPEHAVRETCQGTNRLRLLIGTDRLLGAIIMGDQALSLPLQELIAGQAGIAPVREALLYQPAENLKDTITAFWKEWKHSHAKTQL